MVLALLPVGLLGAVIGSFLNVVVHRVPRRESLISPGSRCPGCGTPVAPWDNIPVLSWLLLRGRCRSCGEAISLRYPLVELLTALVFAAIALAHGVDNDLVVLLPFAAMLIAVAAIDLKHKIVPNRILLPLAVWGVVGSALLRTGELPELLIAGGAAFAFLLVAALAYPAGMGMGDVKLAGIMGLYLGSAVVPAMLVAFLTGSLAGAAVLAREGRSGRKVGIPFAPFLALGGIVGLLVGAELLDLYTERFL
jgi:leader peptidase (prepilin peptidase) / N-methyltransferase